MCVFLYCLCQNIHFSKVLTTSKDCLDLAGVRDKVKIFKVRVESWVMYCVCESPHKDKNTENKVSVYVVEIQRYMYI